MMSLEGILVIDLSRYGPGKYCTMTLADFGADVISIEIPRRKGKEWKYIADDNSSRYLALNRNKKSITLNLKTDKGREIFYRMAERADVIVEGFRPGVVRRLGIDYEKIRQINPHIIYCSISGYGQEGPYTNRPGHDLSYVGMAGILSMTGYHNGSPVVLGTNIADLGGGYAQSLIGILMALFAREKTGIGEYIDVSMLDGLINWLWIVAAQYFVDGIVPKRGETMMTGSQPCYNIYQTKEGEYITLSILEPWFWEKLCQTLGCEDFIEDQYAIGKRRDEIFTRFRKIFATKSRDEWVNILEKADIPFGPVLNLDEVFSDPQVRDRRMVVEIDHPTIGKIKQLGIPIKFLNNPAKIRSPPPEYGQHTNEILAKMGYKEEEINQLRQDGIIE